MRTKLSLLFISMFMTSLSSYCVALGNGESEIQNEGKRLPIGEIGWYINDFPPYFVVSGKYKGMGILDRLYPHIIDIFPDIKHQFFITNNPGFFKRVDAGHNVCSLSLMKTKIRAEKVYFSKPYLHVLQNAVFIRGKDIDKFANYINEEGRISLKELIEDETLTLGVMQGVSYGHGIDEILRNSINNKNVITRKGKDFNEGLLKMLKLGRIDYMVAYDESIQFLLKKLNFESEYLFIPSAGDSVKLLNQGRVACSKSPVGKWVIDKVNKAIEEENILSKSQGYYMEWLSDGAIQEYMKILRESNEPAKQEEK
ncbi:MAG: TIGR02285 family protein [Gammaproteobacteria bacterium]|nr:MAG: TIGR02285 family protein [Gammaproteobacteria bacterium]